LSARSGQLSLAFGYNKLMNYPNNENGDVFRRMEAHNFDFSKKHVVDFHAVLSTEDAASQIGRMYLADHHSGDKFVNIETKPHQIGGMELLLSKEMLVTYDAISEFEKELAARVAKFEGYLDGWGVLQEE
jgi:hypothetical protein